MTTVPSVPDSDDANQGTLKNIDLPALIEKIIHEHKRIDGRLHSKTILKCTDKKILLLDLHEGTDIESIHSNGLVTVLILDGKIAFKTDRETQTLTKGKMITFQQDVDYRLIAKEDASLLIIMELVKPDGNLTSRVKKQTNK